MHGCGGVGLSAVMIAAAPGARVVGVDVSDEALARARAARRRGEPCRGRRRRRASSPAAAPTSRIDAIGAEPAAAASIAGLRKRGRHVQVGAAPDAARALPMDLVIARELELLGSHGMAAHAYPELLALVESGRLRPGDLVTREIGLDEAPAALAA